MNRRAKAEYLYSLSRVRLQEMNINGPVLRRHPGNDAHLGALAGGNPLKPVFDEVHHPGKKEINNVRRSSCESEAFLDGGRTDIGSDSASRPVRREEMFPVAILTMTWIVLWCSVRAFCKLICRGSTSSKTLSLSKLTADGDPDPRCSSLSRPPGV